MSSVVISGDSSGQVSLTVPSAAGTNTATLPAATGTVMVSGNMPAFSAYANTTQSISSSTFTKLNFQAKEFDTASCFDNTTNYRFTPTVAGYYQINSGYNVGGTITNGLISIFKNGSEYKRGVWFATNYANSTISSIVYFNGSTDYIEIYAYIVGVSIVIGSGSNETWVNGSMIRAA
jgi:hypothetical protein